MIPNAQPREVETGGVTASSTFGISAKDEAHIMGILRDTLYSDKILAILREYSSNAWDSHRVSGKRDIPIKIVLPTSADPTLTIQDFGVGLSHKDVFEVYTQYGASTKRDSDEAVGMLGIGSKSGFSYSDSFTVISCFGGTRRTYVAVLDDSDKGAINLLHQEKCGKETGVTVKIAVKAEDIQEFSEKSKALFRYFEPRPEINCDLPPAPIEKARLTNGMIYTDADSERWVAIMGCVPYRINTDQIRGLNPAPDGGVNEAVFYLSGALYFNIGDVQVSASREELKYSNKTKKALIEKFNNLIDEFVTHTLSGIEKGGFTQWERRLKAQVLNQLHLPIPGFVKDLVSTSTTIKYTPKSFSFARGSRITIASNARLLLKDDDRGIAGFGLSEHDYLIEPVQPARWARVNTELSRILKLSKLDGIPIAQLSSLPWNKPWTPGQKAPRTINPKHRVKKFKLIDSSSTRYGNKSANWEIEKRVPADTDVFTIIHGFKTTGYDIFECVREDKKLAKAFDVQLPEIYGYKTTEKKTITPEKCEGTHYPEWRKQFAYSFLSDPKIKKLLERWRWSQLVSQETSWRVTDTSHKKLVTGLGDGHLITYLVENCQKNRDYFKANKDGLLTEALGLLDQLLVKEKSEANLTLDTIYERYPLLHKTEVSLDAVWGEHSEQWFQYIKLIDDRNSNHVQPDPVYSYQRLHNSDVGRFTSPRQERLAQLLGLARRHP